MIPAIAYCQKDIGLALNLVRWIGFLAEEDGRCMAAEQLLLVPSRHASFRSEHEQILAVANQVFGKVHCYVPEGENERGWPDSANWMFQQALTYVERFFYDDMLWLEPDAVPLYREWFRIIATEFEAVARPLNKSFMGDRVVTRYPHMSGIGVYGRNWRIAPSLVNVARGKLWDIESAGQVMPHAHFTKLIQHVVVDPPSIGLSSLRSGAVIYHRDKRGILIPLLDYHYFMGRCGDHGVFSYKTNFNHPMTRKFYHTNNSTRRYSSQGYSFAFSPYDNFGGAMRGTYTTDEEGQQIALAELVGNPSSSVTEITQEVYEAKTKKKLANPNLPPSEPWQPPTAKINQKPAVLVENPAPSPDQSQVEAKLDRPPVIESIDDVLKTGPVETLAQDLKTPPVKKRRMRRRATAPHTWEEIPEGEIE